MKTPMFFGAILSATFLSGCNHSEKPQLSAIGESCRHWDALAEKSRHPDKEMVARHDRLMAKASAFGAEAQKNYNDPKARQAAIEKEVQAKLDAEAIYDTAYYLETAKGCWEGVRFARELREEAQRRRAMELADEPAVQFQMPAPNYTLHTQPPAPPSPSPIPNLGDAYIPARPNTWGNSPYGTTVPPVMRDQPIDSVNPMIPPVAR